MRFHCWPPPAIGFFAEFRNDGKFHFKDLHHFFRPGTWIHDGLNQIVPSLGDFLYRMEYSHWNDFLMGPAIVSVLFCLVFFKIYGAFRNQGPISLRAPTADVSPDLDHALRFVRILMNVGLFWFFIQAWAEKAGYLHNPHSSDEIDLPFEFAGTMLGFWMARVLTKPFDQRSEKFRSTFFIDFLSSGVIGLLYTLIVSPLTESVAGAVGHALYPVVPGSLDVHEYTPFERHMRPLELLLLAGVTWWSLNRLSKPEEMTRLSSTYQELEADSKWDVLKTMTTSRGSDGRLSAHSGDDALAPGAGRAGLDAGDGGSGNGRRNRGVLTGQARRAKRLHDAFRQERRYVQGIVGIGCICIATVRHISCMCS